MTPARGVFASNHVSLALSIKPISCNRYYGGSRYTARRLRPCEADTTDLPTIDDAVKGMWCANAARGSKRKWYAYAKVWDATAMVSRNILMHRIIMGAADPLVEIDHRDNDGLNNKRSNLRPCTHQENHRFRQPDKDWEAHDAARSLAKEYRAERKIAAEVQAMFELTRQGLYKIRTGRTRRSKAAYEYQDKTTQQKVPTLAQLRVLSPRVGKFGVVAGAS